MIFFFFCFAQKGRFASGDYYRLSIEALRNDKRLVEGLGPPIRSLFLNLGNTNNKLSADEAQVCYYILLTGKVNTGQFHFSDWLNKIRQRLLPRKMVFFEQQTL